jgi:hypothetical protein
MSLCEYKGIFGEPNTGVHKIRLFNFAVVDVVGTILLGYLLSKMTNLNLWISIILMFILGIISHYIFCVPTTLNGILNLN